MSKTSSAASRCCHSAHNGPVLIFFIFKRAMSRKTKRKWLSVWRRSHCGCEQRLLRQAHTQTNTQTHTHSQTETGVKTTGGSERRRDKRKLKKSRSKGKKKNTSFNSNLDNTAGCVAQLNYHITTLFITTGHNAVPTKH